MRGDAVPAFGTAFAGFAIAGAITQMAGTILLIMAFGHRGFVVGTAFSKTEAVQAALVTALFLGERLPLPAWIGIAPGRSDVRRVGQTCVSTCSSRGTPDLYKKKKKK